VMYCTLVHNEPGEGALTYDPNPFNFDARYSGVETSKFEV